MNQPYNVNPHPQIYLSHQPGTSVHNKFRAMQNFQNTTASNSHTGYTNSEIQMSTSNQVRTDYNSRNSTDSIQSYINNSVAESSKSLVHL